MPTISLRLTKEQHEELKRWARDDSRSVQREIIFRLFSPYVVHDRTPEERAELAYPLTNADAQPRDVVTRSGAVVSGVDEGGTRTPPVEPPAPDPNLVSWSDHREVTPDFKKRK